MYVNLNINLTDALANFFPFFLLAKSEADIKQKCYNYHYNEKMRETLQDYS